jgi:hypothetical protein
MNSFLSIDLKELDKISIGHSNAQDLSGNNPLRGKFKEFSGLTEYNFVKKYNLIYRTRGIDMDCDPHTKKNFNQTITLIANKNPDKMFFIINDISVFKIDYQKIKNVQIWPRQFQFTQQYLLKDLDPIQEKKSHWMSCILGRSDNCRTLFFNHIIEKQWEKNNLVSYGCYGMDDRECDDDTCKQYYMDTGGKEKYCNLIPFNNFENKKNKLKDRPLLIKDIGSCFANVVQETFLTKDFCFLTEKSFKPLVQGLYPIILGAVGTMSRLATMGFHIPDYINWQLWDSIPRNELNFNFWGIIQEQLSELFQRHSLKDISKDWYPYAVKNRERMIKLEELNRIEEKAICQWLLCGCHALSNRQYQHLY